MSGHWINQALSICGGQRVDPEIAALVFAGMTVNITTIVRIGAK
jgi:hypothetical protein